MAEKAKKDDALQAFAARFRQALAELGFSTNEQKRLGKLFGISGQAVRKWIEGLSMPTSSRMPEVAKILWVRRAWLQDGEEPMRPVVVLSGAGRGVKSKEPGSLRGGKARESGGGKKEATAQESGATYRVRKDHEGMLTGNEARLLALYRNLTPKQRAALMEIFTSMAQSS